MAKTYKSEDFRGRVQNAKKPHFWIPKNEGDLITGTVKDYRVMTSRFGEGEIMVLKEDETDEEIAVFIGSVIKTAREKDNIQIGEHMGIKYLGTVEGPNADYKDFIVMVDRPEKEKEK